MLRTRKRTKTLFSLLLALVLTAGMMPGMTLMAAAETALQGSGAQDAPYRVQTAEQLKEAVDRGTLDNPVYIRMESDVTFTGETGSAGSTLRPAMTISDGAVVVDLNGKTLQIQPAEESNPAIRLDNARLTVRDGSARETGKLATASSCIIEFQQQDNGENTFVLEKGTLENTLRNGRGVYADDVAGRVEIRGGTIRTQGAWGHLLYAGCDASLSGGSFIGQATIQQAKKGGVILRTAGSEITGGRFDCLVDMDYPNGMITGGLFAEDALSDDMKERAFHGTGYGLKSNEDEVYKWRVDRVSAPDVDDAPQPGDLYVAGVKVTETTADITGNGTASYDSPTHTLTLKNFSYSGSGYVYREPSSYDGSIYSASAGIYYQGSGKQDTLTIRLEGENQIVMNMPSGADISAGGEDQFLDTSAAVYVEGADLILKGDSLSVRSANEGNGELAESCGIFVESRYNGVTSFGGKLTIDGCRIDAVGLSATESGEYAVGSSEGIYGEKEIRIQNSEVSAAGSTSMEESCGIYANDALVMENSRVRVTGGYSILRSSGLYANKELEILGSTVEAQSSQAEGDSLGLYTTGVFRAEKSTITASSGSAAQYSDGILATARAEIVDCQVTADSGVAGRSSAGIYLNESMKISGGSITANGGDSPASKNHGIHADYSLEITGGSKVTASAGAALTSGSIGVNVDGDLVISGKSTVKASGGDTGAATFGTDVEGVLSVEQGSTLEAAGGVSPVSFGLRCGRIMDGYGPVVYWEDVQAYRDSLERNKEAKADTLGGAVVARGYEAGRGVGLLLLRYEGEGESYLVEEALTVNGKLQAQGAGGAVLRVTPEDEDARETVTLTAGAIRAGETWDGSDQTERTSPFETAASYRYVLTEGGSVESCERGEGCPIRPFKDADPKAWYHDSVHWAIEEGVMKGMSDTTFEPNTSTNRAMIVTILYRLEIEEGDSPISNLQSPISFTDVEPGSWYEDAVNWAAANGIVKGTSETTFAPDESITREQFATILFRYAEFKGVKGEAYSVDLSKYTDASSVSDWALDAMNWANGAGLITGVTKTTLEPQSQASRAQAATILMRFSNM